jgi:hypothetical protein
MERRLAGGRRTSEVVRIGDTVLRSAGRGSRVAADVLLYLESIEFPYAPRYLGTDLAGRDVLSYVEGNTTDHPSQRAQGAYEIGGQILRLRHDATAGHRLADGGGCVVHGDPGPYNAIFRAGGPSGAD